MTYEFDEVGDRTKTKPSSGPATTYGYDEAGNLTSVERPKEGEIAEIKDSYAYDGDGLRASQTISATTTYMVWDAGEVVPPLLSDGTNSYVYGPGGLPIEQLNGERHRPIRAPRPAGLNADANRFDRRERRQYDL